jgi:hypothetical protein
LLNAIPTAATLSLPYQRRGGAEFELRAVLIECYAAGAYKHDMFHFDIYYDIVLLARLNELLLQLLRMTM